LTPKVGDKAPALAGRALSGERIDLGKLRGRPVVVEFFRGTW